MDQAFVRTEVQSRFADADVMGIVNNITHLSYLEIANFHFFGDVLGLDLSQTLGMILSTSIEYRRSIKFGTPVAVLSRGESRSGCLVDRTFMLVHAHDTTTVFSRASQRMMMVDARTFRRSQLPSVVRRDLALMMSGELAHPAVVQARGRATVSAQALEKVT